MKLLTIKELGKILNKHPGTIRNWISAGVCPIEITRIGPGKQQSIRFRLDLVEKYLRENTEKYSSPTLRKVRETTHGI